MVMAVTLEGMPLGCEVATFVGRRPESGLRRKDLSPSDDSRRGDLCEAGGAMPRPSGLTEKWGRRAGTSGFSRKFPKGAPSPPADPVGGLFSAYRAHGPRF